MEQVESGSKLEIQEIIKEKMRKKSIIFFLLIAILLPIIAFGQAIPLYDKLQKLRDVTISSPQDNEVLTYETTSSKWKNENLTAYALLASPTFTGTVTIPTPFTLGAVSVLPTGTELNFVDGVTSAIQTQLDAKQATLTNSAGLAAALADETGTGLTVFSTSPTFTTQITTPIIALTGGQIAFPATAAPSADANTLDDYEEGDWTPGLSFGGGTTGITYQTTYTKGRYTKIGNIVIVSAFLQLTSKGSSTGDTLLTGLPFTVLNAFGGYATVSLWFDGITFANQFQGRTALNTTTAYLEETTEAGTATALTNANFADTSILVVNCAYRI